MGAESRDKYIDAMCTWVYINRKDHGFGLNPHKIKPEAVGYQKGKPIRRTTPLVSVWGVGKPVSIFSAHFFLALSFYSMEVGERQYGARNPK